jgi:hypothetical protein
MKGNKSKVIKILNLGEIDLSPTFHTKDNIWPVGFKSQILEHSLEDNKNLVDYYSEIARGPNNTPLFQVTPSNLPHEKVEAYSSSGAWKKMLKKIRNKDVSVSGPQYFGLDKGLVKKMIEQLPNAKNCKNYNFK